VNVAGLLIFIHSAVHDDTCSAIVSGGVGVLSSVYNWKSAEMTWNLIIFNNSEVTDVLEWPPNDFYVMNKKLR